MIGEEPYEEESGERDAEVEPEIEVAAQPERLATAKTSKGQKRKAQSGVAGETGEQKAQLLEEHDFRCAGCGARPSQLEWDHKRELRDLPGGADARVLPAPLSGTRNAG